MAHVTPLHPLVSLNGDCWEWQGTSSQGGYGMAWVAVRKRMGYWHRMNYEYFVGPIADGLQIDHLCRNPPCCNPAHLEAVTPQVNTLRGNSPAAQQARQTHCKNGHPFAGENLLLTKSGRRSCRTCNREAQQRWREAHPGYHARKMRESRARAQ